MQYGEEFIGARLFETITYGLYDGNLNCLREYVQNSIDSNAKNIQIYYENWNNLIIRDDGSGMNFEELQRSLGIGISNKSGSTIGWRGIGIWSGVPACKRIAIISKKKKEKKYRIEINNDILQKESLSDKSIFSVIEESTGQIQELQLGKEESLENDHYTEVRLESILQTQRPIFSEDNISDYLSRVLPVPFDKIKFIFAEEITEWLNERGLVSPEVNITFQGKRIFRYPNRSDMFFHEVIKKEFITGDRVIAIGWFLASNKNEALEEPNRGIFFMKKGFTIGTESLVESLFPGESFNRWQYGEIHILVDEIRENAARNNFERNNIYIADLFNEVGKFLKEIMKQNRYQSLKIQTDLICH